MKHLYKLFLLIIVSDVVMGSAVYGEVIDRELSKTDSEIDAFYGAAAEERGAKTQHAAVEKWNESVKNCKDIQPSEAIPILGSAISNLAKYNVFQVPERIQVFDQAREALIAIPGHALYFAGEIIREQETVKDIGRLKGARNDYDRHRGSVILGVLAHLPSPETTQVLGGFLADDRDLLGQPRGFEVMANSSFAMQALRKIGLRNPPQTGSITDEPADIAIWRNWYEEIKSGKRTFSFLGQKVEYRFKPDGTWETIALANAPDDTPKPAAAIRRPEKVAPSQNVQGIAPPASPRRWIIAAVIAVLAGLVWLLARKRFPHQG